MSNIVYSPNIELIFIRTSNGFMEMDLSNCNTYNIKDGLKQTKAFYWNQQDKMWDLKKRLDIKAGRLMLTELKLWLMEHKINDYVFIGQDETAKKIVSMALVTDSFTDLKEMPETWEMFDTTQHGITLYKHQNEAVEYHVDKQISIVAHEMGLGKTFSSFTIAQTWKAHGALVGDVTMMIGPAFLRVQYVQEAERLGLKCAFYGPKLTKKAIKALDLNIVNYDEADIIVTSYASFAKIAEDQKEIAQYIRNNVGVVIVDEVQYIKNVKAKRSRTFMDFAKVQLTYGVRFLLMSGTPMMNRPAELYNAIRLCRKDYMSYYEFIEKYNGAYQDFIHVKGGRIQKVWKLGGATNQLELYESLQDIMHRRTKAECLDLPEKIRQYIMLADIKVTPPEATSALEFIAKMKPIVAYAKIEKTVEYFETCQKPALIFSDYRKYAVEPMAEALEEKGYKIAMITGGLNDLTKANRVKAFQDGELDALVISRQAASAGLNLFNARTVIFNDFPWSAGAITQAEDRVHRIGVTHAVDIKIMVIGTEKFDHWVGTSLEQKFKAMNQVIDNDYNASLTDEDLLQAAVRMVNENYREYIKPNK